MLFAVRREPDGTPSSFRGMAAQAAPLDGRTPPVEADIWRVLRVHCRGFCPGIVIGVTRAPPSGSDPEALIAGFALHQIAGEL